VLLAIVIHTADASALKPLVNDRDICTLLPVCTQVSLARAGEINSTTSELRNLSEASMASQRCDFGAVD
jgi:hypothetical protein